MDIPKAMLVFVGVCAVTAVLILGVAYWQFTRDTEIYDLFWDEDDDDL